MKKHTLFSFFVILSLLQASLHGFQLETYYEIGIGYRQDFLKWKVDSSPLLNISTEEEWKNVHSSQVTGRVEALACDHFYICGDIDYGRVLTGRKTLDEIDLNATADSEGWLRGRTKGHVWDASGGVGYQFHLCSNRLLLTPLVGYSYHEQRFNDSELEDTVNLVNLFEDVESVNKFRWNGPWFGARMIYSWNCNWRVYGEYQYHIGRYRGHVNDNLISDSFEEQQKARVQGHDLSLGISYSLCKFLLIGLKGNYKNWYGSHGKSLIGTDRGSLRNLSWDSGSIALNLGCFF